MFGSNFKKFNSVLILFLVFISLKNISKFTDNTIEMPSDEYTYQFADDNFSNWNSDDEKYVNFDPDEGKNLEALDLESEIKKSLKKRFELKKRTGSKNISQRRID